MSETETTTEEPKLHEPGIYFGMPESEYHADPALGSSSIKAIVLDPWEFQFDRLYGEDKDTDAMMFGSALHKRFLEGRAAFEAAYYPAAKLVLPAGTLCTIEQMKEWLGKYEVGGLSKLKKADLIETIRRIDPEQPIEELIKREHDAQHEGKTMLSPKRWAQVQLAAEWAQRDPLLSHVMKDGAFTDGAPEVSIFYEDRGVRLKCRFDRLLRHAIVDLKSYAPFFQDANLETTAVKTIERLRYDLQAADYLRGWQHAKPLFAAGKVFGQEPFDGFLEECFDRERPEWIWIMVKSKGAPQPIVVHWKAIFAMKTALDQVDAAIDTFVELRDAYGEMADWPPRRKAFVLSDTEHSTWFGK